MPYGGHQPIWFAGAVSEQPAQAPSPRARRWPVIAALVVGLGLVAAPVAFQMFHRAPLGGTMIDEFRPYMSNAKIDSFRGYLDQIDAANTESAAARLALVDSGTITAADYDTRFAMVGVLNDDWATINADMTDLLDRMGNNLDNFAAVDALPPFAMFPWFFVLPGLAVAAVAASALWSMRRHRSARGRLWALAGLGVAIALAPVAFQMFGRAPLGGDMIDDFRPMMTRERVQNVQRYFVTLGAAEGQLRLGVVPQAAEAGIDASGYPAITQFSADWPSIVLDFNPMIATMSDNVDNFQAVDAMPPFALFPWFFLLPGLIIVGLATVALRRPTVSPPPTPTLSPTPTPPEVIP